MSIIDAKLVLGEKQSVSSTADTTNVIDFGGARDLGNNYHGAGYVNLVVTTAVAGTALKFQLKDSADNSTFAAVGPEIDLTAAAKGKRFSFRMPSTKRYVKGAFTATSGTAGNVTTYIGQPEV